MVRAFVPFGGIEGQKAMMGMVGLPCGKTRLPLNQLTQQQTDDLEDNLCEIGFFRLGKKLTD